MKTETLQAASDHAVRDYPNESCGLVVSVGRKERYVPCRNVAADPKADFEIHGLDWDAAEELGTITMVVHSHPDTGPHPTESDRLGCEHSKLPWTILAVHADPSQPEAPPVVVSSHSFAPMGYEAPLRGREFIFGKQDCYTLVQDYYKRELGIELPDFARTDKFWERGENLYMDNFASAGFEEIPAPAQKGDLILMAIRSDIVNHAGIWLGDKDAMLHHPYEHLSERTVYGGYWAENTRAFIRKVK